jgi:hypothetical protein
MAGFDDSKRVNIWIQLTGLLSQKNLLTCNSESDILDFEL